MPASEESLALLRSIDATLKDLLALSRQRVAKSAQPGPATADDRDLDSKYGDETVRFTPRDWTGASMKGKKFSECPADFLDLLADTYAYFGQKNEEKGALTDKGKPKAEYDRRSERRARGWAARIRSGKHTPPPASTEAPGWAVTDDAEVQY